MSPNTRGALLMMGSMAAFTVNDAIVKLLGGSLPLFQIITLRGALTSVWVFLLARHLGALHLRFDHRDRVLVAMRCVSEIGATFFFLTALMNMPLANVTAVLQALPLTVTLGAALIFGEPVGWRRMLAIGIGFCGMLLIVRPGPDGFTTHAIYALLAVTCVTARDLITRRMSSHVPSMVVTLATALTVTGLGLVGSLTVSWVPLDLQSGLLVFGASVFVLIGYLCSVMVMRVGEVGFIAPFRYTSLVWALGLGWLIFGNWPDPVTMLGAGLVVATGLFTLFRERSRRRGS
ncbi:DMT family transporter [Ruegeria sp. WL0004]|uniref:DMT family transporter n=1 Tax=Ruegeria marisflavi TaxID=2984152 RepID=A0ABT2WY41_9RHOB|nr:DMT family transporter [Ruegeria sp. WL0004]MCU9839935.1 DMT family transporter [Ruegeria sp. WL0004]